MADGEQPVAPKRAAARKSTRLSAVQLETSPPPADDEGRVPSFGEPLRTPRSPVKFTYGGKGKRNSPRKVSPMRPRTSSPSSPTRRDFAPVQKQTRPRASLPSGSGKRRAATPSDAGSDGETTLSSLTSLSDNEPVVVQSKPVSKPRRSLSRKSSSLKTATASTTRLSSDIEVLSDLTSLSSLIRSGRSASKKSLKKAPARVPSESSSDDSIIEIEGPPPAERKPAKRKRRLDVSQAQASPSRALSAVEEDWLVPMEGDLVWVRVDSDGAVVGSEDDMETDTDKGTYWWPAKVLNANADISRVSLFGDSPERNTYGNGEYVQVEVPSPSSANLLPMLSPSRALRFNENNFKVSRPRVAQGSPKKRQKLDIEARWTAARDLMLQADMDNNDGLPTVLSGFFIRGSASRGRRSPPPRGTGNRKDHANDKMVLSAPPQSSVWRAPSCDPTYELPGELILAKERRASTDFWPARLLEYVKPASERQKPKYKARFFDGVIKDLEVGWFYTTSDEGFKMCRLGQEKSNYGLDEDHGEDHKLDGDVASFERTVEDESRATSPLPVLPPPDDFMYDLSLDEQFLYVKPVLSSVIEGNFEPANDRHNNFMRGAARRRSVCETGFSRGSLQWQDVEQLDGLVRVWAERRECRRQIVAQAALGLASLAQGFAPAPGLSDAARATDNEMSTAEHGSAIRPLSPVSREPSPDTEYALEFSEAEAPPSSFITVTSEAETEEAVSLDSRRGLEPPIKLAWKHEQSAAGEHVRDGAVHMETLPHAASPVHQQSERSAERAEPHGHPSPKVIPANTDAGLESSPDRGNVTNNVLHSEKKELPRPKGTFSELSRLDKIAYCQNVLLPEAVLQLLLWRSGQRHTIDVLPPNEERRLRDIALDEAEKTYWVHDIIRMKQAAEGKMLPSLNGTKSKPPAKGVPALTGGTRSRPKKL